MYSSSGRHLPSKHETLSSNPSTKKEKKRKQWGCTFSSEPSFSYIQYALIYFISSQITSPLDHDHMENISLFTITKPFVLFFYTILI
jgi:hypothetical protein